VRFVVFGAARGGAGRSIGARHLAAPPLERAVEVARIGEADEEADLGEREVIVLAVALGEAAAGPIDDGLERGALIAEAAQRGE
jgi:hypothetical protein